ncbi:deoxyribodipyrimidine photo-lyase [Mesorhizobium sp. CU2]|uniref:cryptochrome/photolyase family protein n=1 Tax=unclassified Mesorhizobium TaxID=325217 RepID=UPI00112A2696|nr:MULTISPECIES: deoxyribodipyrimidine photo-lyase [unclassified Mesorhizobium]TPN81852.1 deoxyribodipyrimidine photo-lyase [Mesorhizobium sp. CU3]TPO11061.1 deoxyribodipyrimidine photo-lyase [Mesorhizobium sp. CU2]
MSRKTQSPTIVLFRRDLRLADNAALAAAAERGSPILALYILDEKSENVRTMGAASRWWLHHSLKALGDGMRDIGATLFMAHGRTGDVVSKAISASGADCVFWNRRYEPAEAAVDASLKTHLRGNGLTAQSFDGALLHEPSLLKTGAGTYYKVYTPFSKALESAWDPRDPIDAPTSIDGWTGRFETSSLADFGLLPWKPDWSGGLAEQWAPGEAGAQERFRRFVSDELADYERKRDIPADPATSRLSPHLAFGEITPYQLFAGLRRSRSNGAAKFRKEVAWREFSYHLLFHNPDLRKRSFRAEFEAFPWRDNAPALSKWQSGSTGYPIVDAGMRELWQTGWMHNRVRMVAASFLIKDLMIDWRHGEKWFWDTLVDADPANNPASWQWVAGSGADAAPYFRIFNPVLQGEKFDPRGDYVRRYVPEVAALPDRYIHRPWEAPGGVLKESRIELGRTYPKPIVDHASARDRALTIYQSIKGHADDHNKAG